MKMKSFAMFAVSGLLAASIAYIAPAIADDSAMDDMQLSADTMPNNGSINDNTNNDNTNANPSSDNANSPASNDQGTPDTATGDDDY